MEEAVQTESATESEEAAGEKSEEAVQTESATESEEAAGEKVEEAVQTETAAESEEAAGEEVEEAVQTETAAESEETIEGKVEDAEQPESGTEEKNTTNTENTIVDEEAEESETTSLKEQSKASRSPAKKISNHRASEPVKKCTATYKDGVNGTVFPDHTREFTVCINPKTNQVISCASPPGSEFKGTPTRIGYIFTGWDPAEAVCITEDIIYTAQWSAKEYQVTLHENSGIEYEPTSLIICSYDEEITLNKPVFWARRGYVFAGWNTEKDGSGTSYAGGAIVKNLTDSGYFHLYAQWKADRNGNGIADEEEQCTVRYIINPDDPADSSNQTTGNLLAGDPTPAYKDGSTPTRTGYEFTGWEPDVADTVTSDATYTAKWTAKSYKVTLVLNGGTLADEKNVTSYTYAEGAVLPVADNVTFLCHTFDGWYADSSFSGSPEAEISKSSIGDRVFYAKWTESHTPGKAVKENEKVETCEANGSYDNVIYCAVCSVELSRNTVTVPATGHDLEKVAQKEASCTEAGYEAYWRCQTCKKFFSDEAGTVEISNPIEIKATGHNLEKIAQKDASCTEAGYEAYWRCQTCGKLFSDEAGTVEISNPKEIKATGHNLEKVAQKEASCTEAGYEAYWRCQTCKKLFSDEAGTAEISNPIEIKAMGHNLKKVEKKDATATEEGNSTYWFCDKCNKYFSDAKAETEIKKEDTVLAKLSTVNKKETAASSAKTANATKVTSTTDKTTKSSPKTGDSTDVQLYVILMLVSIGAAAGAGAKRKLKTQR